MRQWKRTVLCLCLAALMVLSACAPGETSQPSGTPTPSASAPASPSPTPAQTPSGGEGAYTPGTYSAQAQGFGGAVEVTMTFDAAGITDVKIVGDKETAGIGGKAVEDMPAQILEAQSAEVDGVAGATYTSTAVREAAASCIAQAKGESATAAVKMAPGTYEAEGYGFAMCEPIRLSVTVDETSIKDIQVNMTENAETPPMLDCVVERLLPRMLENQSISIDAITGATATSNGIRAAVKDCVAQALEAGGSDKSAISAFEVIPEKAGGSETLDTQVLVIGMGGSGTYAAMSAAEQGLQVLAIDKMGKYGGTTSLTSEVMAVNPTRIQEEYNNGQDWIDKAAMREAWLTYTEGDAKTEMVDMLLDNSGDALDWLVYEHDYAFDYVPKTGFTAADVYACKYQFLPNDIGANKAYIAKYFDGIYEDFTQAGGEYMLETEAYELLTDASGRVTGAKAKDLVTGKEYTINAQAVVLATGGFAGNAEMEEKYLSNEYFNLKGEWKCYGLHSNDGKMVQAALDLGAATYNIGMPPMVHNAGTVAFLPGFETNPVEGQMGARTGRPLVWSSGDLPLDMLISAYGMAVDPSGARFTTETQVSMLNSWIAGPRFYGIWSQEQVEVLKTEGFKEVPSGPATIYLGYQGAIPAETPIPNADEVLEAGIQAGIVFKADTLEELAQLTGMDADTLVNTVETYNGYCETGVDEDFGKDAKYLEKIGEGPYYAIAGAPYCYTTCGALDINENFQVLKEDGSVIEGLYAIGTDSMGVLFSEKKAYVTFGGGANGWALTSGFLCGKVLGEELK